MTAKVWKQGDVLYLAPETQLERSAAFTLSEGSYLSDHNLFRFPATMVNAYVIHRTYGDDGALYDPGVRNLLLTDEKPSHVPWPDMQGFSPWKHQQEALNYLVSRLWKTGSAGLFSGMGTGKSAVLIATLAHFKPYTSLIVCERNMVETWGEMFDEYRPDFEYRVITLPSGLTLKARAKLVAEAYDYWPDAVSLVFVTNYEAVWQGALGHELSRHEFDLIALDESHRIKSPAAKVSQFLYRLGKKASYRVAMTGTPSHDKPLDVYAQYRFLDDSIFGTSYARFKDQYAIEIDRGKYRQVVGYKNQDELSQKMYSRAFRVPESVLDLPELVLADRWVELEPSARELYLAFRDNLVLELEQGTLIAGNILTKSLRLQQIANGYIPLNDPLMRDFGVTMEMVSEAKFDALGELLSGLPEDEPIVVFGRFLTDLDQIRSAATLHGRAYLEQSGRAHDWKVFQNSRSGGKVLGVQIQAGGSGINLTRARYGIYFGVGHSLGQYEQSQRRLHRPGQKHTTTLYHLWVKDSIDTLVRRALREKKDIATFLVDNFRRDM